MTTHTTQTRKITVNHQIYTQIIKDKYHSAFDRKVEESVPWLQMRGKWLAKAGFTIGTPVTVKVSEGCLVLIVE